MKYVTIKLTKDQARELPSIISTYIELDLKAQLQEYGHIDDNDKSHYAFIRRIRASIAKQVG